MDFRDWLILVGIVIILGILLDGYRRMRLARMDSLKMSKNMGGEIDTSPLDDDFNPELPGGGARVVGRTEPTLDDSAPEGADNTALEEPLQLDDTPLVANAEDRPESASLAESSQLSATDGAATTVEQAKSSDQHKSDNVATDDDEHEVIVINVDAKPSLTFRGSDIKKLLEACGMEHGEMSIFHRHEEDDLLSPVQFSVANAVEPGYFDPSKMDDLTTPGVSFFMSMPGPKNYMQAFEFMLETAQCFANNLHGELHDERRSVLTKQTIEHCKQRVREFERKQLSKAKA